VPVHHYVCPEKQPKSKESARGERERARARERARERESERERERERARARASESVCVQVQPRVEICFLLVPQLTNSLRHQIFDIFGYDVADLFFLWFDFFKNVEPDGRTCGWNACLVLCGEFLCI